MSKIKTSKGLLSWVYNGALVGMMPFSKINLKRFMSNMVSKEIEKGKGKRVLKILRKYFNYEKKTRNRYVGEGKYFFVRDRN